MAAAPDTDRRSARAEDAERIVIGAATYRLLFDNHPLPVWIYDRTTLRFLEVNDAAITTYGYTRDEFLEMTIDQIRPEEDLPKLLEHLQTLAEGQHAASRWRHRWKDGSIRIVDIISHTVTLHGRPAEIVVVRDITDLHNSDSGWRVFEERFRTAVEALPLPAMLYMQNGDVLVVNRLWTETTGYEREALRTLHDWTTLAYGPDAGVIRARIAELFEDRDRPQAEERSIRCADGSYRTWIFNSVPIASGPEEQSAMLTVATDMTDRVRWGEEITAQLEELRRWQRAMIDREERVMELKHEVNKLAADLGRPSPYPEVEA
ncbi:MAG: PAS domain S-box protein [Chthonomonadales bacterium]|nr:PAS domain S-box protein [Chthonomonadales bacterium]